MSQSSRMTSRRQPQTSVAVKRLTRDLMDLKADPLPGISASPLNDNIFEWHFNIEGTGALQGLYIHCAMEFSDDFPLKPPKIRCCTEFSGPLECLPLLAYGDHIHIAYGRWSSTYSVSWILLHIQSVFLEERPDIPKKHHQRYLNSFRCSGCGHSKKTPFPKKRKRRRARKNPSTDSSVFAPWTELPYDLVAWMLTFLDGVSLRRVKWTNRDWAYVFDKYNLGIREELFCYATRSSYRDCVLGFGLSETLTGRNNRYKVHMDYLSLDAWEDGVRVSVWGEPLTHWIPLVLSKEHGERAKDLVVRYLKEIDPDPLIAIARLMNGIVIGISKSVTEREEVARSSGELLMSDKALVGYFGLHQILVWLVTKDPNLFYDAQQKAHQFMSSDPIDYSKTRIPDLGEHLVYLTCCEDLSWDDVSQTVLFEVWTRNVRWYTKENRALLEPSSYNISEIFRRTKVSRMIVLFQVFFVTEVRSNRLCSELLEEYNKNLGRPLRRSILAFRTFCRDLARSNWQDWSFAEQYRFYWSCLNIRMPEHADFVEFLRKATVESEKAGYHRPPRRR